MGLLGEVTSQEVEDAIKPPPRPICQDGYEGDFVVDKMQELKSGPKGDYYTAELVFNNEDGKRVRVYHIVSLSPGARKMVFKFLTHLGINPADWDDPSELQGLIGRAKLKVKKNNKGEDQNEVLWFIDRR